MHFITVQHLKNMYCIKQIYSDPDDHYNGGSVSLDPQWHVKDPGDFDKRSSPSKVNVIGKPSMTMSG